MEDFVEKNRTSSSLSKEHPIWFAFLIHLFDMGFSLVVGFLIGLIIAIFFLQKGQGMPDINLFAIKIALPIGFATSYYAGYILYWRYTKNFLALTSLLLIALIWGVINLVNPTFGELTKFQTILINLVAQPMIYAAGWMTARQTSLKLYIPPRGWIIAGFILGGIFAFIELIGFFARLSG